MSTKSHYVTRKLEFILVFAAFFFHKALFEIEMFFRSVFMRQSKPILYYFPDIPTAMYYIQQGRKKYAKHKKYTLTDSMRIARGVFVNAKGATHFYIDPALAAVMVATGKEPKDYDLNTPSESYGWNFDETRDLLNALDALSRGNTYYWNLYYGEPSHIRVVKKDNAAVLIDTTDNPLYHQ